MGVGVRWMVALNKLLTSLNLLRSKMSITIRQANGLQTRY
jgi:hypothetical protein